MRVFNNNNNFIFYSHKFENNVRSSDSCSDTIPFNGNQEPRKCIHSFVFYYLAVNGNKLKYTIFRLPMVEGFFFSF